jgi:multicomponent Na+:H+ antiporter subunit E
MAITLWLFLRRSLWFGLVAAACWAVLTANSGWGFFTLLLPLLLLWQWHYPLPMPALRWRYLPACLLLFGRQLLLGGFDVAVRALGWRPLDSSNFCHYQSQLTSPASRLLLASLISLLPGTCTISLQPDGMLRLHVLDQTANWQQEIAALEWQLARLFGQSGPGEQP